MRKIYIATSNPGKLYDFTAAAAPFGVKIAAVPGIEKLSPASENAPTFEANACKKAEHYSRSIQGCYVLADDSGLKVDALDGAPGVLSARYAAASANEPDEPAGAPPHSNCSDADNNAKLLAEMRDIPDEQRGASFVCVLAVAREGRLVACFRGEIQGTILREPRGTGGFGYDPLFFVRSTGSTFAELSPELKSECSHRGQAFRKFLKWYASLPEEVPATPATAKIPSRT
jgi:XTP/dITP diphosphohydrolase